MILLQLITLYIFFGTITATPVSYQYVRFVSNSNSKPEASRRSRSFAFSENSFWSGDAQPEINSLAFEEHRGHITPDFSNGLDYPDPLLLTGQEAKRTARYLYRKPLFFEEIDHVNALLRNQDERRRSGLAGNKLGSLRPSLPFYRFKKNYYDFF